MNDAVVSLDPRFHTPGYAERRLAELRLGRAMECFAAIAHKQQKKNHNELADVMRLFTQVARRYHKHGHPPTFTPIEKEIHAIPRSIRRTFPGMPVEQITRLSTVCEQCKLPKHAMKVGGVVQQCRCKKAVKAVIA